MASTLPARSTQAYRRGQKTRRPILICFRQALLPCFCLCSACFTFRVVVTKALRQASSVLRTTTSLVDCPVYGLGLVAPQVPTYPSGQIGAFLARKAYKDASLDASCRTVRRPVPEGMPLRYYSAEMHAAAFALPAFLQKALYSSEGKKRRRLAWAA
eukprot:5152138-Amphidinium_carterae.2